MHTIWRLILYSFILLLFTASAFSQSTIVTATVVDQSSVVWANGTYTLQFVPNPQSGNNPSWNGNPFPSTQWSYSGSMDASGHFSQSVPSNNFITPSGSTYTATICSNTSAPCINVTRMTFQGTTQDISTPITQAAIPFLVPAQVIPRAYTDAEVNVQTSQAGYFYQNVTSNSPRYWSGLVWSNFGGTVSSVTIGNLPPLFNTTLGGTAGNPTYSFSQLNAAANTVYANCAATGGLPSFCSITAAMIPTNINTTGQSGTTLAFAATPVVCTGNNWSKGIDIHGNSTCAQVAFSNLSSNIHTVQMNNGTGANNTTFWRGDGVWAAPVIPTIPNVQKASHAGCTTATGTGQLCGNTLVFSPGFTSAGSWVAVCQGVAPVISGSLSDPSAIKLLNTVNQTATTVDVVTASQGSGQGASYGTIVCIGTGT